MAQFLIDVYIEGELSLEVEANTAEEAEQIAASEALAYPVEELSNRYVSCDVFEDDADEDEGE